MSKSPEIIIAASKDAIAGCVAIVTGSASYRYDVESNAYYIKLLNRESGPYINQKRVTAILDIATDGTLAGVELVLDPLPLPPIKDYYADIVQIKNERAKT